MQYGSVPLLALLGRRSAFLGIVMLDIGLICCLSMLGIVISYALWRSGGPPDDPTPLKG